MDGNNFYISDFQKSKLMQEELSAKSLNSLAGTKAKNTIDAYRSDWDDFCDWCKYHKQTSFPATAETIVNYINDLADYAKTATIRRRVSAISENYNAAITSGIKVENPCREWIVKEALTGLTRLKGGAQTGKTPIYWDQLCDMIKCIDTKGLGGLRDKAVLLLGFMGAFRRSEISGLDVTDIKRVHQGIIVTVRQSKTDQQQMGQQVGIPCISDDDFDCVKAVEQWITAANLVDGPLFRSILKNNTASKNRLSSKSINVIVKKYVSMIGLNPDLYGAHSLRHGFATYAALNGVEERLIMRQTRHRSVEMVRRYINEADLFVNNPISAIFNKK